MSELSLADITQIIGRGMDARITSLPQFVKPTLIESPCFMQDSLAEEPITGDVLKNLYNIYVGYILSALQMNDYVVGNRKIRDILGTVGTSGTFEAFIDNQMLVEGLSGSMEAQRDPYSLPTSTSVEVDKGNREDEYNANKNNREAGRSYRDAKDWNIKDKARTQQANNSGVVGSKYDVHKASQLSISSGRTIEVSFSTGADTPPIMVPITIKFNTRLIPEAVVEYILSADFSQTVAERWLQYRSGEIRLIKDLILGVDKLQRRAKALKADKDKALWDIFRNKRNAQGNHVLRIAAGKGSYNLSNSILMIDEETAMRYSKRSGFDFNSVKDRNKFFGSTYILFIVLVDRRYSRVSIYTNGIDQSASYSFNEMKSSGASDKMSIKDVMEYLSKAQFPKF